MMDRRTLLVSAAGLAVATPPRPGRAVEATVPLWPGEPPGGGGPPGPETIDARGAISSVARPHLIAVRPAVPCGTAMLVAGGGGYRRIAMAEEAMPAAHWLTAHGIAAYVLAYRLPGEGWAAGPLAPLQDAQRALRLIRAGTAGGSVPTRLGVLGFSAGGHLMGLAATRSAQVSYPPLDAADRLPAHPDAAALIYPVITLEPPYDRTFTRRMLIGTHPSAVLSAEWSVQTQVHADCPPVFLVQADDDPIADPANTLLMAETCRRAGVPVDLHRLPSGGHGFGMGRPGSPSEAWPDWYATWLQRIKLLPA